MRRAGGPPGGGGGGGALKILAIAALAVFVLAGVAAAALYVMGPADLIRAQIVARVKAETGRDLVIGGPSSFAFWPSLGVTMADVSLSAPPGMTAPPLVGMKGLTVSVGLLPLLKREVTVERLVLTEPNFHLAVDANGRKSWDFAKTSAGLRTPIRLAQAAPADGAAMSDAPPPGAADPSAAADPTPVPAAAPAIGLEQIALGDVRIERGTLTYQDARSGASETVSGIDLKLTLPSINGTATADGGLTWRGEALALNAQLTSPKALLEATPVQVTAALSGQPIDARFEGAVTLGTSVDVDGDVALKGGSLRSLLAYAGGLAGVPGTGGSDPFNITGKLRAANGTYTMSGLNAAIDKAKGTGDIAVTLGGTRPVLKANLKLAELDLNPYLTGAGPAPAAPAAKKAAAPQPAAPPAGAPAATPDSAQSINDLLNADPAAAPPANGSPQVRGFTQQLGLSDAPLDLSGLSAVQADVSLDASRIRIQDAVIDRLKGRVEIGERLITLSLADVVAFDGRGSGFVTVDARAPVAAVGSNLTFDGFSLLPLAKLAGVKALSGSGKVGGKIAMAGQGTSERQIADTLAGDAKLTLSGGQLKYTSADQTHEIAGLDLALGVTSFTSPLTAQGGLTWNSEKVTFDGTLSTLKELADARPVALKAKVAGRPLTASFDGTIAYGEAPSANGAVAIKTPSVRTLAGWVGSPLPPGPGFGPLDLTGKVVTDGARYALNGGKVALDGETATGDVSVNLAGARPAIKANLRISGLNLNTYLGELGTARAPQPRETGSTAAKPAKSKVPEVRGYTQRGGWSQESYDLGALGLVDVDAKLALGRLLYKQIKVGASQLTVGLKNRVLKTDFTEVQLYSGRGKGLVAVDASDPALPKVVTNLNVTGVDVLPLLKDAADLDWLAGKGNLALGVTGQGKSQRALMGALGGSADLKVNDGAIVGINIPGMLRNIGQGKLGGLSSAPTEKTDFSEMSSSWAINSGVARNSDLKLAGPLIRVTGEGAVKLGERTIDYTLKPKIVADTRGQGGAVDIGGLEVPLKIQGPWEKPKFVPDVKGILKDPNKVIDSVKEIGKQFKGKNANELLDGLLGGKKTAP